MKIQDDFLLDEVRCGFVVPSAIKQAWAAELEVLMEIDRVCQKHNIQYFADWGTLLGTVRHGGFIPWDDDLDIVMKRADYERFMTVARFDMEEGFDVQTFRNQKDFWLFMGKVVGKNHFCFEKEHLRRFHNFPYIACVDIFVLDYVYRNPEMEEKRRRLCKYMLGVADAIVEGRLTRKEQEGNLQRLQEMCGREIPYIADAVEMGRYLYGEVERLFALVPEQEADCLTQLFPWGLKGDTFHFPKEYYETPLYLPFEGMMMPVPYAYDRMLRQRYGDYLKAVKDAGAHNYPFFEGQRINLQKVLDFDLPQFRFREEMLYRSEEELECKAYSYKEMAKECAAELEHMQEELLYLCASPRGKPERVTELLQNSQQLAVDLGTLLEQMPGKGATIVPLLEQYCELLYQIYELWMEPKVQPMSWSPAEKMGELCRQILVALDGSIARKTVLFLPVMARDWSGMQCLWQEAVNTPSCEVCVAPLPYYFKDYDGSARRMCCELSEFPENVNALDYQRLTPEYLQLLHPEVIVIQNPYDAWNPAYSVPQAFYAEQLRRYTETLICVPPLESCKEWKNQESVSAREESNAKYYVTMPGIIYADMVLVKSECRRQLYVKKLTEFAGEDTRKVWEQRIRVAEELNREEEETAGRMKQCKKKLLYGIGKGTRMENPEAARQKYEKNMQIFAQNEEAIEVAVRCFPEEDMGNVCDYDAYYGDPMPVVMEFVQAGKPVMIQNIEL